MVFLNILSFLLIVLGLLLICASIWEYKNSNINKEEKSLGIIYGSSKKVVRVLVLGVLFIFMGLVSLITKNSVVMEVMSLVILGLLGIMYLSERKIG